MDYAANTERDRVIEFMYQLNSEPASVFIDKAGRALSSKRSIVLETRRGYTTLGSLDA